MPRSGSVLYYWSKVIRVRTTVPVTVACRAVVSKTVVNGPVTGNTLCCSRFQPRADAAAIPDTLLGAELFGVAAGTFSDVKRAKPGLLYVGFVMRQNLRAYRYRGTGGQQKMVRCVYLKRLSSPNGAPSARQ